MHLCPQYTRKGHLTHILTHIPTHHRVLQGVHSSEPCTCVPNTRGKVTSPTFPPTIEYCTRCIVPNHAPASPTHAEKSEESIAHMGDAHDLNLAGVQNTPLHVGRGGGPLSATRVVPLCLPIGVVVHHLQQPALPKSAPSFLIISLSLSLSLSRLLARSLARSLCLALSLSLSLSLSLARALSLSLFRQLAASFSLLTLSLLSHFNHTVWRIC